MFPQAVNNSLRFHESSLSGCTVRDVISDHSLSPDLQFPQSPNSQFMYEPEFIDCSADQVVCGLSSTAGGGVISPSVEGLTFDDYGLMSYLFNNSGGTDQVQLAESITDSFGLYEAMKLSDCSGPTLTQLNSEDIESAMLSEFGKSASSFCDTLVPNVMFEKQQQMIPVNGTIAVLGTASSTGLASNTAAVMSTSCTGGCWPTYVKQECNDSPVKAPIVTEATPSTIVRQTAAEVPLFRSLSDWPRLATVTKCGAASQAAQEFGLSSVSEQNWEEIESFLQSENAKSSVVVTTGCQSLNIPKKLDSKISDSCVPVSSNLPDKEHSVDMSESQNDDMTDDSEKSDEEESVDEPGSLLQAELSGQKEKTYFWQYNTQSKGPKGKRLCKVVQHEDPYVLLDFEDPVFDTEVQESSSSSYRHSGKARRGDGNDVTPNPAKLYAIGKELRKLTRLISAMSMPNELPAAVRARTLREKNKYASRVCRLKKKAQHEANKIKLHGLDQEHRQLTKVLTLIKKEIIQRVNGPSRSDCERLATKLDRFIRSHLTVMTAGHTADFVNAVLGRVAEGDRNGGLAFDN